ncbi:glycosyltransferase [Acinetobacter sp. YH16053]|uniref:glycosyltransferase n=1 Tax=Acinetobacter sp. YH16053 TaxID=2601192 RepID=UPI0015D100E0|nr:glycosyltransferase [Acinetobacter sp. YH16053]
MKILLIGEYSGAFYNLANILKKKGHDVFWIHDGDNYKKISGADYSIEYKYIKSNFYIINLILKIYYFILNFLGLKGFLQIRKYNKFIESLKNYEVVQLVNTKPLSDFGAYANLYFIKKLVANNNKVYLSALGDDYVWVKNCLEKKIPYSMFDRMNFLNFHKFSWSLLYVYGFGAKTLNDYIIKNIKGIIPGLYDYLYAYNAQKIKCEDLIPLIVKVDKGAYSMDFNSTPIKIFHGWQENKELRKGNDIFHEAILRLKNKYSDLIDYEVITNLPYDEYIKKYKDCHIFIDQCYSLDRGMNGLLGMAAGKIVLSGFDPSFIKYLGLDNGMEVLINALPDQDFIYNTLESLILDPNKMKAISIESLKFINKYHNEELIYQKFINIWSLEVC